MKKTITKHSLRDWLKLKFLLVLFLCVAGKAYSQTVTIGSGTTTTTSTGSDPINGYYEYMRYQVVYTATELTAAGLPSGAVINGLGWSVSGDYAGGNLLNYTIGLAHTTAADAGSHNTATLTTVKQPFSYNPTVVTAGNFDMINFDTTFTWNGTDNILVDVCTGGPNPYVGPYGQVRTIASSTTNGSRRYECDGCGSQCGNNTTTTNTTKPQIRISYMQACSGTPVPGNAVLVAQPSCGGSFNLNITGSVPAFNLTYQWQDSVPFGAWSDIVGETNATLSMLTTSLTAPKYFRRKVTCTNSFTDAYSGAVLVKPVSAGTPAISSTYCYDSTTITLSGASGGTVTYDWQSSPDSLNWSSLSITTATLKVPTPVSNTYYRCVVYCGVASESSAGIKVVPACAGFGYSVTRNTSVPFTSIQSTGNTFTWAGTSGDDDRTFPIYFPAGFNFSYSGVVRPAFYVCTNGWLSFDTVNTSTAYDNSGTPPNLLVGPFFEDLVTLGNSAANRSYIKYSLTGTAPNRVMTVEWAEMERYNYGSPNLNFQVKMYEGSNNIEFIYGRMQPFDGSGTGDFTYTLGMFGTTPAMGQRLTQQLENTTNFSVINVNNNLPMVPLCNSSYLFTAGGAANYTNVSAIPSNDSSATPVVLTVNPTPCTDGCGTYYTSKSATPSNMGIAPPTSTPDDDVWFKFTAPFSGQVNINVFSSSGYNPAFQVMTTAFDSAGLGAAWFRNVNTNALEQATVSGLMPGTDYLIRVYHAGTGYGSTSGAFSICVNEVIPPPANDDTSGAVLLTVNTTACSPVAGTTLGASASPITVCGGLADDDVWYKFVANNSTDTIRVQGSGTFRAHVQLLSNQFTSLYCQNTTVNAGEVVITTSGLLKDSIYFIRIYHTNAGTATANFTVCVAGPNATVPVLVTGTNTNLTLSSLTVSNSVITSNGGFPVTRSGVLLSTSPFATTSTPGVTDSMTNPLVTNGSYSINFTGLMPGTTYYSRAYAVNSVGTGYGADSMFITPASAVVPTIQTTAANSITANSATIGGNITSDGGASVTASGVVYSTTPHPVLFGSGVVDSTNNPVVTMGSYTKNLAGLTSVTKYYFRAYATNSAGTAYGSEDSFMTAPVIAVFPYFEDFDSIGYNTGYSSVVTGTGTPNDWVVGTPAKTVISAAYSAPNAWITKLVGNYSTYHNAAVVSPQFDFTALTANPVLRFKHKFVTEAGCCDGGWVEMSINGGAWTRVENAIGTGANYNTANATAWYNLSIGAGNSWNGNSSTYASQSNGWITSTAPLAGAGGQGNVKIRFVFYADVSAEFDGWAIDDIEIFSPAAPVVETGTKTNVTFQSARLAGNIISNNYAPVSASGIVLSTSPAPVRGGFGVVDSATNPLVAMGNYQINFNGLVNSTTYYYRSYAVNAVGTTYGPDSSFTTFAAPIAPTLSTLPASNFSYTTATVAANITSDGGATITASGIVYSTTPNPVIGGFGVVDSATNPVVTTGSYGFNLVGLAPATKYYYKAYATNLAGTAYTAQDSIITDFVVSSLPYNQNFETTLNTSWHANTLSAAANQWVLTTPSKTYLNGAHSGTKAWITKAAGIYDNDVDNELISPRFDMSSTTEDPVLRFYHKFVTEAGWDAMVVEISVNGGPWNRLDATLGTGGNFNTPNSYAWYNNTSTNGPMAPDKFSSLNSGTGTDAIYSSQVSGWVQSATRLTGAAGQDSVQFRFRFATDASGQYEGWLVDDIEIVNVAAPTLAASSLVMTPANTSASVSWTNGNGAGRIVVARLTSTAPVAPTNWTLYNANAAFGTGQTTGTGNFVVYNGTGNSVNVTGLSTATNYTFDVYEFNGKYMHVKFGSPVSGGTTTTPVKLVSFAAANNNGDGYLTWATSSEKNNAGFNVERSIDGKHFEYVGFVKGATNSNTLLRYAYADVKVFKATGAHKVYYRLKQIDRDGKFEYSNVVSISEEGAGSFAVKAYPVPFENDVTLAVTASEEGPATIQVMDIQGRIIANQVTQVMEGENAITLDTLHDLNAGVYFVKVVQKGNTQTVRIVKAN